MTKNDLLKLLDPYGPGEQVVFVTFDAGIVVHEEVEVAKDHGTTRTASDGSVFMPVAIYLVDDGKRGRGGVLGVRNLQEILPQAWPKPGEATEQPEGGLQPAPSGLHLALVVRQSTLHALAEHSVTGLGDPLPLNDRESLVLLDAQVVERLLGLARPGDERIDDVILRLAL